MPITNYIITLCLLFWRAVV